MQHSKPAKSTIWLFLILILIAFSHVQPVRADTYWHRTRSERTTDENGKDNGHYEIWFYTDDDDESGEGDGFLFELYDKDGNLIEADYFSMDEWHGPYDRSPDGDGKGPTKPTPESIRDLIGRLGKGGNGPKEKANNPISSMRRAHGQGLDPIWNPPEENYRTAPGSSNPHKKTPGTIRDKARRGHHPIKRNLGGNNTPAPPTQPGFGGMGTRDDNHPERVNPVPELRTMTHKQKMTGPGLTSLHIVPVKLSHPLNAPVDIHVKNTPFSRLPFELRYRADSTGPFKPVTGIRHEFARKNDQTVLTLHPDRPGQYQVRFRANHKTAWTPWQSFQVTGPNETERLTRNMKLNPAGAGAINPQPKLPGKNAGMLHTSIQRPQGAVERISTTNGLAAKSIPMVAPTVVTPKNGRKFMLTGNSMHIQAKISHAKGQHIKVQVEQKRQGRFVTIKKGITIYPGTTKTSVDILARGTGEYRLRVKNNDGKAPWSGWTNFTVGRLMQHAPRLNATKTASQKGKQITPLPGAPTMQPQSIR